MTLTQQRAVGTAGRAPTPPPAARRASLGAEIIGSVGTLVSIMLLTLVAELVLVGPVRHVRNQQVTYDTFRSQLAEGTLPTGQVDYAGKLVEPGAPIAKITIPAIGLEQVVLEGTTANVLMSGPGHRRDTALPGQAGVSVIMGRRAAYGGTFRKLSSLRVGNEIAVLTAQGASKYFVRGIRRAGDKAPAITQGSSQLTLITGDGPPFLANDVLRVDAELVTPVMPSPSRPVTTASLSKAEQAMAGDRSVLLPLLLWSQLLLLLAVVLAWVRSVWGRWQSWIVRVPVAAAVGLQVAHLVVQLLPNLL